MIDSIRKFFSTISGAQWWTLIVIPALISAVNLWIPAGTLHNALLLLLSGGGIQSLVSNRTPSAQGGSVKTAA